MQQEYFGTNSLEKLSQVLARYSPKRIFLITGGKSYSESGASSALKKILSNYLVTTFSDFSNPPDLTGVEKGIDLYKEYGGDVFIAVGGGRVIDTAKLINILAAQSGKASDYILKKSAITIKGKPLIAIPTTSGSGSEATNFAVIYVNKTKHSLAHEYILPDVSIYDPQLTDSATPYQTAVSGLDALSQAIESYWSIHSTDESKACAKESIELVLEYLPQAVNDPSAEARLQMAKAAHLSGKAINLTKTTAAHAISYPFTSRFGLSHGHAVGMTLGNLYLFNSEVKENDLVDKRGIKYIKEVFADLNDMFHCVDARAVRDTLYSFMAKIGLSSRLSDVGVKNKADIQTILDNVDLDRMGNNPRSISNNALRVLVIGKGDFE